ncbi:hypothetical protein WEU38_09105 [Cyanobacterium aponinum AL20118]|uniref:DUF2726 domain-containing protein n=2 Tax=Cyanobacterium TaxID=102234 RepID=A0AAF1C5F9_9CHRO|nr:hypothetical protein [Cyanobacterium aponinum]WPF86979.1 hypothetical protein SAY89_09125 [Cyanobacterium aponinum AL20115]
MIDQEYIYQLIYRKEWRELLDFVYQYSKISTSDELIVNAVKIFEDELFRELHKGSETKDFQDILEKLFLLDKGRAYKLSEGRSSRVIVELVKLYNAQGLKKKAYEYAKYNPSDEICAEVINLYEKTLPKVVEHSQSHKIRVTKNRNKPNVNYVRSLFRSNQEIEFFMVVREIYQMYVVYPNVALSCVIDFNKIKDNLAQEERDFFFKGIIDCVVFDQHQNYIPVKFFELDSHYHDSFEQQKKDNYKDHILSLAGQKLYRIRKSSNEQGRQEFMKLIRELSIMDS